MVKPCGLPDTLRFAHSELGKKMALNFRLLIFHFYA